MKSPSKGWTGMFATRLQAGLRHRHLPYHLALLATALCLPSLWLGWVTDDHMHRGTILGVPELAGFDRSPAELFAFLDGDIETNHRMMDAGLLPWWSYEQLRLAFFRPFTGLTHWIDYQLWPNTPALMHLQSLAWFAGVVIAATVFYRRVMGPLGVAGLAALLFAIDDAHALPVVWLANRNAVLGMFFGFLTLIAYDRWRRDAWLPGAVLAPLAFGVGLSSNEGAVATAAYLLAYALFLDRGSRLRRFFALAPCAGVGVAWVIAYQLLGYGASGSGVYIEPAREPLRFALAVVERAPMLVWGQFASPPSDLLAMLSADTRRWVWGLALAFMAIMILLLAPLVRRDRVARFCAFGMTLSLLPACATFTSDRLLMLTGLGGMGLLALFFKAVTTRDEQPAFHPTWWRAARSLAVPLAVVHLVIAPGSLLVSTRNLLTFRSVLDTAAASLPTDEGVRDRQLLIVNAPVIMTSFFLPVIQSLEGRPVPARTLILASGMHPIELHRRDAHTITLRPHAGFFPPVGTPDPDAGTPPRRFDPRYVFQVLDRLFRDDAHPMRRGQRVELTGLTIEITALTDDGRPAEAAFRFEHPLDDTGYQWLQWGEGQFVPLNLPAPGESTTLPAITLQPPAR